MAESLINWVGAGACVRVGITNRMGGISRGSYQGLNLGFHVGDDSAAVAANRAALEAELPGIAWMNQVHGNEIRVADTSRTPDADGLLILPGFARAAAVMVADCVPLLIYDREQPLGAVVHVGRSGLLKRIAWKAVAELTILGAQELVGIVGPSICGRCYEVPEDMRDMAEALAPGSASETRWGTPAIDIPRALDVQLRETEAIDVVHMNLCTYEDANYFSHRRSAPTGRFAGVIELMRDTPA